MWWCGFLTDDNTTLGISEFGQEIFFWSPVLRSHLFSEHSFQITILFRSLLLKVKVKSKIFRSPILRCTISLEFLENVNFFLFWHSVQLPSLSNILKKAFDKDQLSFINMSSTEGKGGVQKMILDDSEEVGVRTFP